MSLLEWAVWMVTGVVVAHVLGCVASLWIILATADMEAVMNEPACFATYWSYYKCVYALHRAGS